jgi:uncharacterized coiled-coil protein SlyX
MFESLSKAKKLEKAKDLFEKAMTYDRQWQREAYEDFRFRDGYQWPDEERAILSDEMKPCLTFNLTKASIDLIMGMNEDNRKKHRASPVEPTDAFQAEVLNDIVDNIMDANDFIDEEDAALESAAISGRGYVAIDFIPDPNKFGEIQLQQIAVSAHEVHFDPSARRPTLDDAAFICWDRWINKYDFHMKYPNVTNKQLDEILSDKSLMASVAEGNAQPVYDNTTADLGSEESDYDVPLDETDNYLYFDKVKHVIRVVQLEYWESYKRFFGYDPESDSFVEFTGTPLKQAKEAYLEQYGQELQYEVIMDKKVKWLQFTGDRILFDGDSPLPYSGFSVVPVFAYRDVSGRTANHFGVVRLMKDPQREVNKRWSQALNMLNQQVQPGIYAELDAFVNNQQAEVALKEAGSIAWTNNGALQAGKILERKVPTFPNAPMQMEQFSQDIMKKITGINPDLLGQDRGRQEAGVVIRLRQQQGITLLKPLFRAFNKMKKELFKRQLAIIMAYMPDEQILRILGQGERYEIDKETGVITDKMSNMQANIRDVRNLEYNIKAEEAPGNMTKRMLEISTYMEMQQGGFPVDPIAVVEKLELTATEKARWIEYINQQQQGQQDKEERMIELESQFKDREIAVDEQSNLINFVLGVAKIEHMSTKDKLNVMVEGMKLAAESEQADNDNATKLLTELIKGEQKKNESKNKPVGQKPAGSK